MMWEKEQDLSYQRVKNILKQKELRQPDIGLAIIDKYINEKVWRIQK